MGLIKLKDGTTFSNSVLSYASPSSKNSILLTIPGTDILKYASTFGDPEKTQEISYESMYTRDYYTGYTVLESLNVVQRMDHTVISLGSSGETGFRTEYSVPVEYLPEALRPKTTEQ